MTTVTPPNHFRLTEDEKHSALWLRFKAHFLDRLDKARGRNDLPQPEHETALLRGEIKCLRSLIALGDDRPTVTGDENAH